jgi:hypothetical protein
MLVHDQSPGGEIGPAGRSSVSPSIWQAAAIIEAPALATRSGARRALVRRVASSCPTAHGGRLRLRHADMNAVRRPFLLAICSGRSAAALLVLDERVADHRRRGADRQRPFRRIGSSLSRWAVELLSSAASWRSSCAGFPLRRRAARSGAQRKRRRASSSARWWRDDSRPERIAYAGSVALARCARDRARQIDKHQSGARCR